MADLCAGDYRVLGSLGRFYGLPANHGFPETLIYAVWAVTMIPPALYALHRVGWRLQYDARSICYGGLIGLLGAGGQMLLFHAVRTGPAYLIFPVISLSPVVTVVLSLALLHERTGKLGALGSSWHYAHCPCLTIRAAHPRAPMASCGSCRPLGCWLPGACRPSS